MKHLALTLASLLAIAPSCAQFDQMDPAQFEGLVTRVYNVAGLTASLSKQKFSPNTRANIIAACDQATALVNESAALPTSLPMLVDQFSIQLRNVGVKDEDILLVRGLVIVVDTSFNGLDLDLSVGGSERTKQLVLAILKGLRDGLM